jgi:putative cell wall-binding protein
MPAAARALALLLCCALALGACGDGGGSAGSVTVTAGGAAPARPSFPDIATKNTVRVPSSSPTSTAAAVAVAAYPGGGPGQRAGTVVLADARDWQGALAGAVLMAPPLGAPLLLTDQGSLPSETAAALKLLAPPGSGIANGAQGIRLGAAAGPPGLRITSLPGADPFTLAAAIDDYRARIAGRRSAAVMVVSSEQPAFAMPAAALAAKSGDPVLFATRTSVPAATRAAIRLHGRPRIYLLGPASVLSGAVERELRTLGTVTRITGRDAQGTAVAFARFRDGAFGWGVSDPGHGMQIASPRRPGDAGASAALAARGSYGPLLLAADDGSLPPRLGAYLRDIQPGYSSDPVRGVYNRAWIIGDDDAVSLRAQTAIDGLLEIQRVTTRASTR